MYNKTFAAYSQTYIKKAITLKDMNTKILNLDYGLNNMIYQNKKLINKD
jgi:hypothetical protein